MIKRKKKKEAWGRWDLKKIDWEKAERIFQPEAKDIIERLKAKSDEYPLIKDTLFLLAVGALFGASLLVPGLPRLIGATDDGLTGYQKRRLRYNLQRLKKQQMVEIVEENGKQIIKITKRGKARALKYKFKELKIKKPKIWDHRWRMVIFDIPERKRIARDFFRQKLKDIGFLSLQESIFIHPYPCFDQIDLIRQAFDLGGEDIRYGVVEKIEGEGELKNWFNL